MLSLQEIKKILASKRILWLALIPVFMNFAFIAVFGSPVFVGDEWDGFVPFLLKARIEGFAWEDVWRAHNEHRIVTTKIIYYLQSFLSLDPRWLMVISSCVWWLTFVELERVLKFDVPAHGKVGILLSLFLGLFFFSTIQSENFFWGFQLCWFLAGLGSVGTITSAIERRYLRMYSFAALAYFSLASWAALVPVVFLIFILTYKDLSVKSERRTLLFQLGLFAGISCVALLFYSAGLHVEHHEKMSLSPFSAPLQFLMYIIVLMGVPFGSMGFYVSLPMGVLICVLPFWLRTRGPNKVTKYELALILYAVLVAVIIAKGRAAVWKWGDPAAYRYATMFFPAWMAFWALALRSASGRLKPLGVIVLALVINVWVADSKGFDHEKGAFETRAKAGECLKRLISSEDQIQVSEDYECAKQLYGNDKFFDAARALREWHPEMW